MVNSTILRALQSSTDLVAADLLNDARIELPDSWKWGHTGFSVHDAVAVRADHYDGIERLARYLLRPEDLLVSTPSPRLSARAIAGNPDSEASLRALRPPRASRPQGSASRRSGPGAPEAVPRR